MTNPSFWADEGRGSTKKIAPIIITRTDVEIRNLVLFLIADDRVGGNKPSSKEPLKTISAAKKKEINHALPQLEPPWV